MTPVHNDQIENAAHLFYAGHRCERLEGGPDRLIHLCAVHLAQVFCLTHRRSLEAAMRVRSEIESEGCEGFIDHERGTTRMVLVRDTARKAMHMVSAAELLLLVRSRQSCNDPPMTDG